MNNEFILSEENTAAAKREGIAREIDGRTRKNTRGLRRKLSAREEALCAAAEIIAAQAFGAVPILALGNFSMPDFWLERGRLIGVDVKFQFREGKDYICISPKGLAKRKRNGIKYFCAVEQIGNSRKFRIIGFIALDKVTSFPTNYFGDDTRDPAHKIPRAALIPFGKFIIETIYENDMEILFGFHEELTFEEQLHHALLNAAAGLEDEEHDIRIVELEEEYALAEVEDNDPFNF